MSCIKRSIAAGKMPHQKIILRDNSCRREISQQCIRTRKQRVLNGEFLFTFHTHELNVMRNVIKAFVIFPNKIITFVATYLSRKSYVNCEAVFMRELHERFPSLLTSHINCTALKFCWVFQYNEQLLQKAHVHRETFIK